MKRVLKVAAAVAATAVAIYALVGFIAFGWDPALWGFGGRVFAVVLWLWLSSGIEMFLFKGSRHGTDAR